MSEEEEKEKTEFLDISFSGVGSKTLRLLKNCKETIPGNKSFTKERKSFNVRYEFLFDEHFKCSYPRVTTQQEDVGENEKKSWDGIKSNAMLIKVSNNMFSSLVWFYPQTQNDIPLHSGKYNTAGLKGVVMILHGACEHIGRYEYLINRLVRNGYVVFGMDQRGHGMFHQKKRNLLGINEEGKCTCSNCKDRENRICYLDNIQTNLDDIKMAIIEIDKIFTRINVFLPFYILGHSLGAMHARTLVLDMRFCKKSFFLRINEQVEREMYLHFSGLILSGDGWKTGGITESKTFQNTMKFCVDICKFPNKTFKFKIPISTDIDIETISQDKFEQLKYWMDPLVCVKSYLGVAMEIYKLVNRSRDSSIFLQMKKTKMNILFLKGEDDKTMLNFHEITKRISKIPSVEVRIYAKGRHELFNEIKELREKVFDDLIDWLERMNVNFSKRGIKKEERKRLNSNELPKKIKIKNKERKIVIKIQGKGNDDEKFFSNDDSKTQKKE